MGIGRYSFVLYFSAIKKQKRKCHSHRSSKNWPRTTPFSNPCSPAIPGKNTFGSPGMINGACWKSSATFAMKRWRIFVPRVRVTLETPGTTPPGINPPAWVTERKYLEQDYEQVLERFLQERSDSIDWLRSLKHPNWEQGYEHPKLGFLSAGFFLSNWLAHDYLHIRQITRLKYDYLGAMSGIDVAYAGNWI